MPPYEYTFGGPVMKDHLWFFTAGRLTSQDSTRQHVRHRNIPYTFTDEQKRYEGKLTYSLNSNHRFQGAYTKIIRNAVNDTFNTVNVDGPGEPVHRQQPQDLLAVNYNGVLSSNVLRRRPLHEAPLQFSRHRRAEPGSHQRHADAGPERRHALLVVDVLRRMHARNATTTTCS